MRMFVGVAVLALMATPAWATFTNLGFEDGIAPWVSEGPGAGLELNSGIFGPGGPKEGSNYGSLQTGGTDAQYAHQTSSTAFPSEIVTLTGWVAAGVLGPQSPRDIVVQLIDGSSTNDTVIDEWRVTIPVTYGFGWTPFTLTGHIQTGHVKIRWGHTGGAWASATAVHLDGLEFVPEPASLGLFGLALLPLLRRRR